LGLLDKEAANAAAMDAAMHGALSSVRTEARELSLFHDVSSASPKERIYA